MQRDQNVIVSRPEAANPTLGAAWPDVADEFRPLRGSSDEGAERLECEGRDPILQSQCDQSRPGYAEVEAIVRLAARQIGRVVRGPRFEPDLPVPSGGDLWGVGLVPADKPAEEFARLGGDIHPQQKMPHDWHAVATQDEALDFLEVQRPSRSRSGFRVRPSGLVAASFEKTMKESPARRLRPRVSVVFLAHRERPC